MSNSSISFEIQGFIDRCDSLNRELNCAFTQIAFDHFQYTVDIQLASKINRVRREAFFVNEIVSKERPNFPLRLDVCINGTGVWLNDQKTAKDFPILADRKWEMNGEITCQKNRLARLRSQAILIRSLFL